MSSKRHILHIAPTPFFADRGCHIRIRGVVRCLDKLGFDNTVCTYHHGQDVSDVTTKRIKPIKAYTQTEAGPSKHKLLADWKLLWLALGQYRKLKPVAIHAHLHEGLLIGSIIKVLFFWRRTPLIGDMQGSLTGELDSHGAFEKRSFLKSFMRRIELFLMWNADYIVCSSTRSLHMIQDQFGVSDDKISLAQDGADPAENYSEKTHAKLMKHLSLPTDKTIAVYSGALLDAKGLEELKAVILGSKRNPQLHFLIIGYPKDNILPFIKNNRLTHSCTVTGQVSFKRLSAYLSLAQIAIDPKNSDAGEGSGKILNYIARGLPVVAFDTQNNREFLPEGTRLAKDTNAMIDQLEELTNDATVRAEVSGDNLTHFTKLYTWSITTKQLKQAYSNAFKLKKS